MEPYGIALIGCGTVGGGVAQLLLEQPERLAARARQRLKLLYDAPKRSRCLLDWVNEIGAASSR